MSESELAFKADNISKVYRIGAKDIAKDSLGSVLIRFSKKSY